MATIQHVMRYDLKELSPEELYRVYMDKQVNFGMAAKAIDERRKQNRLHVTAEEANVAGAGPGQRIIVGPDLGFNIHNLHVFTSGRDARSDRYHTHGDALKCYVQSSGFGETADEKFEVKVGDFCHVPANVWHGTINPNPEPLVFLAAQQFPGTYRQVATPFIRLEYPDKPPDVKDLSLEELGKLDPRLLYLRYIEEQLEFGKVALEMQLRREQKRLFLPAAEAPLTAWGPGRHHIMSPELGFDIYSFHLFMEHVAPRTEQAQTKTSGDAIRYYMAGRGVEVIDD